MSIKVLRYFLSLRNCCFTLFFGKTFLSYLSLPSNTFLLFSFQCTTDTFLQVSMVEMRRVELLTPCLQGRCSPN